MTVLQPSAGLKINHLQLIALPFSLVTRKWWKCKNVLRILMDHKHLPSLSSIDTILVVPSSFADVSLVLVSRKNIKLLTIILKTAKSLFCYLSLHGFA